ncbi:MAG: ATP-binding protein [Euryarchaeota archaeon]|nr:ATP-binding protein [Euryarchaeota archaeon]
MLEEEWKKEGGRLIVLYGRRRIGKTRLLTEFTKNKEGIFYIAENSSVQIQINGLKNETSDFLNDSLLKDLKIKDWEQLFEYLAKNLPKERFYIVLDEFSYLIKSQKRVLSTLQKFWDIHFSSSPVFVVLSGSLLGLMSEMVLSHASPLYGRRTRDIFLGEIPFKYAINFVDMSFQEAIQLYTAVGGVPEYLLKAAEYDSLDEFLKRELFSKNGYFYREPYYILSQELKELKTYFSILNAIAYGCTRPTEIANFIGIKARSIYPYLENLIRLGIVEREVSILGSQKRGIYLIKDQIFDFWFNFVFKHRGEIEKEKFKLKKGELSTFYGKKFEKFVRDKIFHYLLPNYNRVGRWWHKNEEIDIVSINDETKEIAFFEAKWSDLSVKDAERIVLELKKKAKLVKDGRREEHFGIIAKSIEDKKSLKKNGILVYDLEDLEEALISKE